PACRTCSQCRHVGILARAHVVVDVLRRFATLGAAKVGPVGLLLADAPGAVGVEIDGHDRFVVLTESAPRVVETVIVGLLVPDGRIAEKAKEGPGELPLLTSACFTTETDTFLSHCMQLSTSKASIDKGNAIDRKGSARSREFRSENEN
ncbi:unnamed protein product, partial [Ectocarpus sp. 13 AM-2016]